MSCKMIIFCVLLIGFKLTGSIPFSEEPARQISPPLNNWQGEQNTHEHSRNHGTAVPQAQNVHSITKPRNRYENDNEYDSHRSIQQRGEYGLKKHKFPPLQSLPIKDNHPGHHTLTNGRGMNSYSSLEDEYSIRTTNNPINVENQGYKHQNWPRHSQSQSFTGASGRDIASQQFPLLPLEQESYHEIDKKLPEFPRYNQHQSQHLNGDASYPLHSNIPFNPIIKKQDVRQFQQAESNSRSHIGAAVYKNYDEVPVIAHKRAEFERYRDVRNSPPHSGPIYLPPINYHRPDTLKKEGNYYDSSDRRHVQNHPEYNSPQRNIFPAVSNSEIDNSENNKFLKYPVSGPGPNNQGTFMNFFNGVSPLSSFVKNPSTSMYTYSDDPAGEEIDIIEENSKNSASSSIANLQSYQDLFKHISIAPKKGNINTYFENPKLKHLPHGHRFMVIHTNGTIEYINQNEPNMEKKSHRGLAQKEDVIRRDNDKLPLEPFYREFPRPMTVKDQPIQHLQVAEASIVDNNPSIAPQQTNNDFVPLERDFGNNHNTPSQLKGPSWDRDYIPTELHKPLSSDILPFSDKDRTNSDRNKEFTNSSSDKSDYNAPLIASDNDNIPPTVQSADSVYSHDYNDKTYKSTRETFQTPSNLSLKEKEIQEYLDSISNNTEPITLSTHKSDIPHRITHTTPSSHVRTSVHPNEEDRSIQEFLNSLSKKSVSNQQPSTSTIVDDSSTTQIPVTSNSSSSTTTPADQIMTISPIEKMTKDNIENNDEQYKSTTQSHHDRYKEEYFEDNVDEFIKKGAKRTKDTTPSFRDIKKKDSKSTTPADQIMTISPIEKMTKDNIENNDEQYKSTTQSHHDRYKEEYFEDNVDEFIKKGAKRTKDTTPSFRDIKKKDSKSNTPADQIMTISPIEKVTKDNIENNDQQYKSTTQSHLDRYEEENFEDNVDEFIKKGAKRTKDTTPGFRDIKKKDSKSNTPADQIMTISPIEKVTKDNIENNDQQYKSTTQSHLGRYEEENFEDNVDEFMKKGAKRTKDTTPGFRDIKKKDSKSNTPADQIMTISPIEKVTKDNIENNDQQYKSTTQSHLDRYEEENFEDIVDELIKKGAKRTKDTTPSFRDIKNKDSKSTTDDYLASTNDPVNFGDNSTNATHSTKQSDINTGESITLNDIKFILDVPDESDGTLKITVNTPDNTGNDDKSSNGTLYIRIDTKDYKENKHHTTVDETNDKKVCDKDTKDHNLLFDLLNNVVLNKTADKDFINQLPSDNSTINLWYLIQMPRKNQARVEKNKKITTYSNGTIVEELTETTWEDKDDSEPNIVKTTKTSHKDHKKHT